MILFKGAGDDFCLGREALGQPGPVLEAYGVRERSDTIFNLYGAFRNAKVPIIAVVQGRAVGLGCALAALCDITIASDRARFQLPEMSHRIMPTIAMSALVDRVPRKAATYLVYSTQEIDAQKALTFGLVSNVVPATELMPLSPISSSILKNAARRFAGSQRIRALRFQHEHPGSQRSCA